MEHRNFAAFFLSIENTKYWVIESESQHDKSRSMPTVGFSQPILLSLELPFRGQGVKLVKKIFD